MSGNKRNKFGYWIDGKLQSKINDDETIKFIIKTINDVKIQKEYKDFQLNIQKYEKQIIDGSSSQDTNSNSKEAKINHNY